MLTSNEPELRVILNPDFFETNSKQHTIMKLSELTIDLLFNKYGKNTASIVIPILDYNKSYIYNFVINHCKLSFLFSNKTTDVINADGLLINIADNKVCFTDFKIQDLQPITYIQTDSENLIKFVKKFIDYITGRIEEYDLELKSSVNLFNNSESKEYTRFQTETNKIISQELDEDLTNRTLVVKYTNGMTIIVPCAVKNEHNIGGE